MPRRHPATRPPAGFGLRPRASWCLDLERGPAFHTRVSSSGRTAVIDAWWCGVGDLVAIAMRWLVQQAGASFFDPVCFSSRQQDAETNSYPLRDTVVQKKYLKSTLVVDLTLGSSHF